MFRRLGALLALTLAAVAPAAAQTWPDRPITFIVPFAPGGTTDITARVVGEALSRVLNQRVLVENVAGAGGSTGAARVKNAAPDGYTFLVGNLGSQVATSGMHRNLPYNPIDDFEHIALLNSNPMLVVVKNALPVRNFQEFIAHLRANHGSMSYGSGGVGATSHLTCLFMASLLGVTAEHVPYRGSGPALNDLMGGQLDYVCDQSTAIIPHAQAGTVRAVVVTSANRLPQLPNVETSAEAGLPNFRVAGWNGLWAPRGLPAPIQQRMREAVVTALADANVRQRFADVAADMPEPAHLTGEGLRGLVQSELARWVPIIRAANVQLQ
jgi:tripartite-type tricarboxylate transporter receptor subunit TctC